MPWDHEIAFIVRSYLCLCIFYIESSISVKYIWFATKFYNFKYTYLILISLWFHVLYSTVFKTHGCIRRTPISAGQDAPQFHQAKDAPQFQQAKTHPNFSWPNQEKNFAKQSTNIKRDEINIMNIINDKTYNLHNKFFNNDKRYMKVTLKSKIIEVVRLLILADYRVF